MIKIGPFEAIELADSGAMGHVWRGRHTETNTPVAIKVIPRTESASEGHVFRLRSEIRAIARIDHPGVISIIDEGVIEDPAGLVGDHSIPKGSPYIVMEWAADGHLGDRIPDMTWSELRTILLSLLEALAAAHARGIIHRDIKPKNILFSRGRLRLADFGVAFERETEQNDPSLGKIVGSPNYMSPEQVLCRWRDYGPWTDLYAVGCLAWVLATGRPLYQGDSFLDIFRAHLGDDPPTFEPMFPVPENFVRWLEGLLAKRPRSRFQFAADAAYQLLALNDPINSDATTSGLGEAQETKSDQTVALPPVFVPQHHRTWAPEEFDASAAPSLPETWRRPLPRPEGTALPGTGLAVFSMATGDFLGRERERDRLWLALGRASRGEGGSVFFVEGPPGVGKTALTRWLSERTHELGASHTLRVRHQVGDDGLDAIKQMLHHFFRTSGLEGDERFKRIRRMLSHWDAQHLTAEFDALLDDAQTSTGDTGRLRLASPSERFLSLQRLLETLSKRRTVVVVLDDIQWSPLAMEWVKHVHQSAPKLPVIWVATWRELAPSITPLSFVRRQDLVAMDNVHSMALEPLDDADTKTLIQSRVQLSDETLDTLVTRTQGNPLFAEKLVEHWIQSERLLGTEAGFHIRARERPDLPDSVHEIWQSRIRSLRLNRTDDRQFALELAAVLGQRFHKSLWEAACHHARIQCDLTLLNDLERFGLIQHEGEGDFEFAHSLLCESLQRQAVDARRAPLMNLACAQALEDSPRVTWHRVGRHYQAAGHYWAAVSAFQRASESRNGIDDLNGELDMLYRMADCLRRAKVPRADRRWAFVRVRWGRAKSSLGHNSKAIRHLGHARIHMDTQAETDLFAEALLNEAFIGSGPSIASATASSPISMFEEAIATLESSSNLPLRVRAHALFARALRNVNQNEKANEQITLMEQVVANADLTSIPVNARNQILVHLSSERFVRSCSAGDMDQALKRSIELEEHVRQWGNRVRLGMVLHGRVELFMMTESFSDAANAARSAIEALSAVGAAELKLAAMMALAICEIQLGNYDEGMRLQGICSEGMKRSARVMISRMMIGPFLGGFARIGRWREWEASFAELKELMTQGKFKVKMGELIEFSIDHTAAVGHVQRADRLIDLLLDAYTRAGLTNGVERLTKQRRKLINQKTPASLNRTA